VLHRLLNFVGGELIKRSRAQIFDLDGVVPFFGLRVDGDIFLQMPLEPTLVIQGFANGDAIQPGLQRTTLAKNI